jgi:hypothetical protein
VTNQSPRRLAAIGLAILLIVGVSYAIFSSARQALGPGAVAVQGLIGSEKAPFFADPGVVAALHRGGFDVTTVTAGSRQIADADLSKQDFAFPAGIPQGTKIHTDHAGSSAIVPFFTPMAIATWRPIVDLLTAAGVVHTVNGVTTLDVDGYMKLVDKNTRWKDLPNNTAYPVNKSILITSTDVRKSNSAAMYLALTSYVANGANIVQNDAEVAPLMSRLAPLFLRQGFVASSTEEPFDDYLVQGMGKSPMVMIYESQFIQHAAANDGSITPDMVLMYPDPTIFSKHTFVGLTDNGIKLGEFLATDPEMRSLATQYGFRTSDAAGFDKFVADHHVNVPSQILDVIEPPTYETLEAMITRLEALYDGQGLPSAVPDDSGLGTAPPATPASASQSLSPGSGAGAPSPSSSTP